MSFNKSTIQINSDDFNLGEFYPSDYERRKTAAWVYLEPSPPSSPAFPPEYIALSIRADDVTTLCGTSVTLNVEYTLTPADYDGVVDIFWEQITGQTVIIDDPTLKNPTITYNSIESADFIMRVYIDKGKSQEIFADANIIRTPLGISIVGNNNSSRQNNININRSAIQVVSISNVTTAGNTLRSSMSKHLSSGSKITIRDTRLDVANYVQIPTTVDQLGNSLDTYNYNDTTFAQLCWEIPYYRGGSDIIYGVEVYKNGILDITFDGAVKSTLVPLVGNNYTVALLYTDLYNGNINRTHKKDYLNPSAISANSASYSPTWMCQDIAIVGNNLTSTVSDSFINRSGIQVLTLSGTSVVGNNLFTKVINSVVTRINGISIGT